MSPSVLRALRRLARLEAIQLSYVSAAGHTQAASPETLMAILGALGTPVRTEDDILAAVEAVAARHRRQYLEPVFVAWEGKPKRVLARLPEAIGSREICAQIKLETGQTRHVPWRHQAATGREDAAKVVRELLLPALPFGYHNLELTCREGVSKSLVVSAPARSYSEPGAAAAQRQWGVFLPMYAAHSKNSWGAGNLGDWERLGQWVGSCGGQVFATLPLLATFLDQPTCSPSPYSPASRLFWNEFYLDIDSIPELALCREARRLINSAAFRRRLDAFRRRPQVDYASEMAARRQVLELLARWFFSHSSSRREQFQRFLNERPAVADYARFRAACDQSRQSWSQWPERQRQGQLKAGDYSEATKQYHLYAQWLADEQVRMTAEKCRSSGVRFYLDLPLGVHPDGYDVWRERDIFALGASAGAPPDPFFSKGQDWGFAPLHPQAMRQDRYRYVLEYLRFQMSHAGLLRIDHVMGLHRLYWVPRGLPPTQGAYVTYPAEELYALLCLESHRHKTALVGENLGTVPPAVNTGLKRHALRRMYVVQFEQRPDPRQALAIPPVHCVASINTHDMPAFAAHWTGQDILDRVDLGLLHGQELAKEKQRRRVLSAALIKFLQREGCLTRKRPSTGDMLRACLKWLSSSPAELVLINLEDLWLELLPQNVPGTFKERPNWQRKARFRLDQIEHMPELRDLLREIDEIRKTHA